MLLSYIREGERGDLRAVYVGFLGRRTYLKIFSSGTYK